ncbi:hypothetical protein ACFE04_003315 [Oxalis oulophora]
MTRLYTTQCSFLFIIYFLIYNYIQASTDQELTKGFKATLNPSVKSFQSLLQDSTGNFSLGFLRVDSTQLALAIIHIPSNEQLWLANPTSLAPWSDKTELIFNGSLVIIGSKSRVFWSTGSTNGDKVMLLNNSNLQLQTQDGAVSWQSFEFPSNTLVENQNFTSTMTLVNGIYSMRLGDTFIGLYAKFNENREQMYWKHTALQVKAQIVEDGPPIYARVNSDGFLGMYQSSDVTPVDIEAFNSYQRGITGLRLLRIETDGNLKGYIWDGSTWVLEYESIRDTCELPDPCGSYGLCKSGSGCSCLNNMTETKSGSCYGSSNPDGDYCNTEGLKNYDVIRRAGVELPFKELMRYETASSLDLCEGICVRNCSCWGTVYNNASGFCYILDYPTQTIVAVSDQSKVGYFKVRAGTGKSKRNSSFVIGIGILCGTVLMLVLGVGFYSYRMWRKRRGVTGLLEEENRISPGPYKNLGSDSFNSVELSCR